MKLIHVVPMNDSKTHNVSDQYCWCEPQIQKEGKQGEPYQSGKKSPKVRFKNVRYAQQTWIHKPQDKSRSVRDLRVQKIEMEVE